jgi:hypothetical protein
MTRFFENYLENKFARLAVPFAGVVLVCAGVWGAVAVKERQSDDKQLSAAGMWSDRSTGLMWTKQDNEAFVNWREAAHYCRALSLGGYGGWRLPEREEIRSLWNGHQLKPGITLTVLDAYLWTANVDGPDYGPGTSHAVVFFPYDTVVNVNVGNMPLERRDSGRALCVRGPR